jgi:hypothetical protein
VVRWPVFDSYYRENCPAHYHFSQRLGSKRKFTFPNSALYGNGKDNGAEHLRFFPGLGQQSSELLRTLALSPNLCLMPGPWLCLNH